MKKKMIQAWRRSSQLANTAKWWLTGLSAKDYKIFAAVVIKWIGLVLAVVLVSSIVRIHFLIANGGDEFTLSLVQVKCGFWAVTSLFVLVVGGAAAEHRLTHPKN